MGTNTAGAAITDDKVVCLACLEEIQRRKDWYIDMGLQAAADKCQKLENYAQEYCVHKGYITK